MQKKRNKLQKKKITKIEKESDLGSVSLVPSPGEVASLYFLVKSRLTESKVDFLEL